LQYAPIFVLAIARSYSSVVSTMLGQHPMLFGFPELKLFACPTIGDLEASLSVASRTPDFGHRSPGLVRALAELVYGDQSLRSLARAQQWLGQRADLSGEDVFDMLMQCVWPRVAVEKSPEHVISRPVLERLAESYPRARYLHLTRHPVTAAASMRRHMQLTDEHAVAFCFYSWYETNFRLVEFGAKLPSDRYLRVRAEDVLNHPLQHLHRIAAWLELPAHDAAIQAMLHPERSPFACFAPSASGVRGGNDREFLRDPIPHGVQCPAIVDQPEDWNGPASLWSAVLELADRFGYHARQVL
jgi:hypothetical protein